jgi:hypothetical protein
LFSIDFASIIVPIQTAYYTLEYEPNTCQLLPFLLIPLDNWRPTNHQTKAQLMKKVFYLLVLSIFFFSVSGAAQDCTSNVTLILNNTSGGFHAGQTVKLISLSDATEYDEKSDAKGQVVFALPCDQRFDVKIANYPYKGQVKSSSYNNSSSTMNYSYGPNMVENQKNFAMDDAQKKTVDMAINQLPDTTRIPGSTMRQPHDMENYATYDIILKGLDSKPLVGEMITFSGTERNKSFKGKTSSSGRVHLYLPKGDVYQVNFQYHSNYRIQEVKYSKGTATARIDIMYMGTKEFLRRKKEEEERAKAEKIRVAQALRKSNNEFTEDKVLETVLDRNFKKWEDKLIICDVSYEMMPYAAKLAEWYERNEAAEEHTQFVFFFNGIIRDGGTTTGTYHQTAQGYDSLIALIRDVHSNQKGKDAKYDIEGLINGDGVKNSYKDVLLIIDKDRTMYDYEQFMKLKIPVHIVLCVDPRRVNPQHLEVAWKTHGSIHTSTEDITDMGKYVEGDTLTIEGVKYQIMGGKFVQL